MLNGGKLTNLLRNGLWVKSADTTFLLENNLVTPNVCSVQQFFGKGKRNVGSLVHKFGEMCITMYRGSSHCTKLANQCTPGTWVGFAEGHPIGTYHVSKPNTKNIVLTKIMTFLQKSYVDWNKIKKLAVIPTSYERLDDNEELETVPIINQQ